MTASRDGDRGEPEITLRGVCLGAAMTVVFMSANLYLGLKTGMTFSSSIPAATISMGVLALFGNAGILENNIVQTQASAAGTLCNVILVLPGLVITHFWSGFALWQTMTLCLLGGLLGVAFSVPLRRVLVVDCDLPFPEGVAAAEVLRAAPSQGTGRSGGGLRALGLSAAVAALLDFCTNGLRVLPDQLSGTWQIGHAVFRAGGNLSLALIGVGYLVRIGACLALLLGVALAWGLAVPILTSVTAGLPDDATAAAEAVWSDKVRLIGAGIIALAGCWTVITLVGPMAAALRPAKRETTKDNSRATRDVPIWVAAAAVLALCAGTFGLFAVFAAGGPFAKVLLPFVAVTVVATAVFGFLMAAACGYMAGVLGSSSSPISGIGILGTLLVAVCLSFAQSTSDPATERFVVAFTLFVTAFIVTVSSIANDNLQDLKTGHILQATPWKQQAVLAIGVVVGALTVAPALKIFYEAYGFVGALPRPGMDPANALPAPQATLMAQIAQGIVQHHLDWTMVAIGAALGIVLVLMERQLGRRGISMPALTVGIGMYLPVAVVLTIALGGVVGWLTERRIARRTASGRAKEAQDNGRRRGVLIASGFLVGESLVGILVALVDTVAGRSGSLATVANAGGTASHVIGAAAFATSLACVYALIVRAAVARAFTRA